MEKLVDWTLKLIGYLILIYLLTRIIFLLGGGFAFMPVNDGTQCYNVNLFRPLVYKEAPCETQEK